VFYLEVSKSGTALKKAGFRHNTQIPNLLKIILAGIDPSLKLLVVNRIKPSPPQWDFEVFLYSHIPRPLLE